MTTTLSTKTVGSSPSEVEAETKHLKPGDTTEWGFPVIDYGYDVEEYEQDVRTLEKLRQQEESKRT